VGDVAIALSSSGVHSNGFSLVRKIVSDSFACAKGERGFSWSDRPELLGGQSLGEVLLTPTQIYVKPVLAARQAGIEIRSMAHITGGGLPENLPRCLPAGLSLKIEPQSWEIPPIFRWLAEAGEVNSSAMLNTFNMGIGFVLLVPPEQADQTISWFESQEIAACAIGKAIAGTGELLGLESFEF
jgi:phosphoribosylformylglycinamidine cyclo-ligase